MTALGRDVPAPRAEDDRFLRRARQVTVLAVSGVFGLLVLLWVIEQLATLLVLVVFSLFCGFALEPAVNRLARRGWSRGRATLTVYAVLAAVTAAAGWLLGTIVVQQVSTLLGALPEYTREVAVLLQERFDLELSPDDVAQNVGTAGDLTRSLIGGALGLGATVLGVLFQVLTVLTLAFYFAMDGPRLRRAVCSALPTRHQREVLRAWDIAISRTAGYVYFRGVLAVLSAATHFVAFQLLGVPFALTLGLWVGVLSQFIPAVGTYLAGALPVAIALAEDPGTALLVLAVIVVYQQIENYVISPPLSARSMRIHPAMGFIAAIAGIALVGPLGALLALPVVATTQSFLSAYVVRHEMVDDELLDDR